MDCNCTNPPGGGVECDQGQLALCQVVDGVCRTACVNLPWQNIEMIPALHCANWLLGLVLASPRRKNVILSPVDLRILETGTYQHKKRNIDVHFKAPISLAAKIRPLLRRTDKRQGSTKVAHPTLDAIVSQVIMVLGNIARINPVGGISMRDSLTLDLNLSRSDIAELAIPFSNISQRYPGGLRVTLSDMGEVDTVEQAITVVFQRASGISNW